MSGGPEDFAGFMTFMAEGSTVRLPCGHTLEFDAPPTEEELRRAVEEHMATCGERRA